MTKSGRFHLNSVSSSSKARSSGSLDGKEDSLRSTHVGRENHQDHEQTPSENLLGKKLKAVGSRRNSFK